MRFRFCHFRAGFSSSPHPQTPLHTHRLGVYHERPSCSWPMQDWGLSTYIIKLRIYCLPLRSPHSLDPIHLSRSLLLTSQQEPSALFRPGSLLTTNLICPSSPVYFVKFLLLIGTTSDSMAVCQAFYLNYLIICIMLFSNKLKRKSTVILPISHKSGNLGVRQLNCELGFSPSRLTLICHEPHPS